MTVGYKVRNGNPFYCPSEIVICKKCANERAPGGIYKGKEATVKPISSKSIWTGKPECLFCNKPLNVQVQ